VAAHARVGGGDLVEQSLAAAGDDHLIAALMERLGEGAANAAGAAGDEDGVAGQMHRVLRRTFAYVEWS
jgi:hypothetical protein